MFSHRSILLRRSSSAREARPAVCARRVASVRATAAPISYAPTQKATRVRLKTRSDCELGVSIYPLFKYNAVGGGGWGTVEDLGQGKLMLKFDTDVLVIPDLSWRTASMFFMPIPPPLNIAIRPLRLEGILDQYTGIVNLEFDADFYFSASPVYSAPPLVVRTVLTTESVRGRFREATGKRIVNGAGTLVGVATVEKCNDVLMDNFLMLPTDALAVMSSEFEFE